MTSLLSKAMGAMRFLLRTSLVICNVPYLNFDVLGVIVRAAVIAFPFMRGNLRSACKFFKNETDKIPLLRLYIPELPVRPQVISVRKIITLKRKSGGTVLRLKKILINSNRWFGLAETLSSREWLVRYQRDHMKVLKRMWFSYTRWRLPWSLGHKTVYNCTERYCYLRLSLEKWLLEQAFWHARPCKIKCLW